MLDTVTMATDPCAVVSGRPKPTLSPNSLGGSVICIIEWISRDSIRETFCANIPFESPGLDQTGNIRHARNRITHGSAGSSNTKSSLSHSKAEPGSADTVNHLISTLFVPNYCRSSLTFHSSREKRTAGSEWKKCLWRSSERAAAYHELLDGRLYCGRSWRRSVKPE